jgi:hypothetical protein
MAKKAKGKKTAKAAKAANGNGGSHGAGRENITQFVRKQLAAGKKNETVASLAAKKFAKKNINTAYVSWHRWKMGQLGLI